MNRGTFRTRALQLADAVGSDRWDATAGVGEVDLYLTAALDQEWAHVLDAAPHLRQALRTVTPANDLVALADLSTTTERLRRILRVSSGFNVYSQGRLQDYAEAEEFSALSFAWYRLGENLKLIPAPSGDVKVWVTHLPKRLDELDETSVIAAPGHGTDALFEMCAIHEAAAFILSKGGAETAEAQELRGMAAPIRAQYLQTLARETGDPLMFRYADTREEWGG